MRGKFLAADAEIIDSKKILRAFVEQSYVIIAWVWCYFRLIITEYNKELCKWCSCSGLEASLTQIDNLVSGKYIREKYHKIWWIQSTTRVSPNQLLYLTCFTHTWYISRAIHILIFALQRFFIPTTRQLKRLESVTRAPIYTHFSETITGAQTIRAYGDQKRFMKQSEEMVEDNIVYFFAGWAANRSDISVSLLYLV